MIIDKVRDYVIEAERIEEITKKIEEARHIKLMDNNLMIRIVYKVPSDNRGNNWLRLRLGETGKDGQSYVSLAYRNMIPFADRPNLEKSIEVKVEDYEAMVELLDAAGFEKLSIQENLRTKYTMYHVDSGLEFEISMDCWPKIEDKRFVQIKPERIISLDAWNDIEELLELQDARSDSDSVNKYYISKCNKSSLEMPYIGFERFDDERKIYFQKKNHHRDMYHGLFLYITEKCQLRCKHCFMGERLEKPQEMTAQHALTVAETFKMLGAKDVTIIGGEPTLHPDFIEIVKKICTMGFERVIIDTNGLNIQKILQLSPKEVHHVKVSVDSATADFHDNIRGEGNFVKTINNIRKLVDAGFRVCINCTLFKTNIENVQRMRSLCCDTGATMLNFHAFSPIGNGTGISDLIASPEQFKKAYLEIRDTVSPIDTSFPRTWIDAEDKNDKDICEYQGCIGLRLGRFSVYPDGSAYICTVASEKYKPYMYISENGDMKILKESEFEMFLNGVKENGKFHCPMEKAVRSYMPICKCWKTLLP